MLTNISLTWLIIFLLFRLIATALSLGVKIGFWYRGFIHWFIHWLIDSILFNREGKLFSSGSSSSLQWSIKCIIEAQSIFHWSPLAHTTSCVDLCSSNSDVLKVPFAQYWLFRYCLLNKGSWLQIGLIVDAQYRGLWHSRHYSGYWAMKWIWRQQWRY